ncbi:MAG: ROK family protein [Lachnospiraceae bacterium]
MKRYCIGSKIGVHHIQLGIFDPSGNVIKFWSIDTLKGNGCKGILQELTDSLYSMLAKLNISVAEVSGIGVSVPGAVNQEGIVHYSIPLGWGIVNVSAILQSLSDIPAVTGCSRDMAVLGEHWMMKEAAPSNLALFMLGETIQGSLMIDNRLIFHKDGFSGDLGNMSGFQNIKQELRDFFHLSQYENPFADKVLDSITRAMAEAVNDIECIVPLEQILICSSSEEGGSVIMKRLNKVTDISISLSHLGGAAELYGSACHAFGK